MPTSHETFILWLALSLGIHVATLAWWPLPPDWRIGAPSHLLVTLRSASSPAGTGKTGGPASPSTQERRAGAPVPQQQDLPAKQPQAISIPAKSVPSLVTQPALPARSEAKSPVIETGGTDDVPPAPRHDVGESCIQRKGPAAEKDVEASELGNGESGEGWRQGTGPGSKTGGSAGSGSGPGAGTGTARATPLGYGENPPMPYPRTARRRGWQGEVLLRVDVSATGSVLAVHLEKSSGYAILDDTALRTVAGWGFRPARSGGIPRADTVLVPIRFKLRPP